jgi:hypothetical protein
MVDLSPAAQAVMDAWGNVIRADNYEGRVEVPIAAALRAAADQVVPEEPLNGGDQRWMFERDARQASRRKLLTIADELEGVTYGTYRCELKANAQ